MSASQSGILQADTSVDAVDFTRREVDCPCASNESGPSRCISTAFRSRTPQRISLSGATHPLWRRDGRELYYISADRQLTAASLSVQGSDITILERRPLFSMAPVDLSSTNERVQYAVLGNGEQFLLNVMRRAASPKRNGRPQLAGVATRSKP